MENEVKKVRESSKKDGKTAKKGQKRPKKVTAGYLERAALHYLGRFSTSEKNLRDVLIRKIRRRNEAFASPTEEQLGWVDDVVKKCVRYNYVDDAAYARQRAELLLRRGKPVRMIAQDLRHKGVPENLARHAIAGLSDDADVDADRRAAAAYIKRRRFGAFRREMPDAEMVKSKIEKELASMARAGFGYELARDLLHLEVDDIIDLLE